MTTKHVPAPTKNGPLIYTDAQMISALRRHAQGQKTLSRKAYEQRRASNDPSTGSFERRFGSWGNAVRLAGLTARPQDPQLRGTTTKWSRDQLVDALVQCLHETENTSLPVYSAWREAQEPERRAELPPATSIRFRLGSWSHATQLACQYDQNHNCPEEREAS